MKIFKKIILFFILSILFNSFAFAVTIHITTITSTPDFCAGENISVSYSKTGTFSSGNIFEVQLSASNGSFTSPSIIGSVSSTAGGTIPCVIPAGAAAGTGYKIRIVSDNPNAISDTSGLFTITIIPTVSAGTDQTICSNSTATLNGSIGGSASSATWTGAPSGNFSPNNTTLNAVFTPTVAQITAGSASLTLTTDISGGCASISDVVLITINPVAVVSAGIDQSVCSGSTISLAGVISGGATTATWTGGPSGNFSPNNTTLNAVYTPTAAQITAGTVTLTLTSNDPNGPCSAVNDNMTITISGGATVNAGTDQTICAGSTVTLAGSFGGLATSATWTGGPSGNFSPNNTTLNAVYTPTAAQITAGTATLTLTTDDPPGACSAAVDNVVITINPAATVNAGTDQTICSNSTATLSGSVGGGASSGTWSGGGTFSPNANTLNAVWTPSAAQITAGTATLTLTTNDPSGPCVSVNDVVIITINPAATANAGTDQTICSNSTATLNGSIGGSATSGSWSGGGTFSPNANTLNAVWTPTAGQISAGTATLTLTTNDPAGVCSAGVDNIVITISSAATVNAGTDQTICSNSTATLNGGVGGGATNGTWSGGGTFSPNANTLNAVWTPSAAQIAAGTATLTLTTNDPAGPCGSVNDFVVITINPAATVNAGTDQTICSSLTVTLNGSVGGGASSGTWSGGGTFSPNANTLNAVWTPSAAQITAGTATLTLTTNDPSGVCNAAVDNVVVTINPTPTAPTASSNSAVCTGKTLNLFAGTISGVTYHWAGPNSFSSTNQNPTISNVTLAATGVYTVYVVSSFGCSSSTNSTTVTVNQSPNLGVTLSLPSICLGQQSSTITITGADTYTWSPIVGLNVTTGNVVIASPIVNSTYTVIGTSILGCTSSIPATISIIPIPIISASANPNEFCSGESSILNVTSTGPTVANSFSWQPPTGLNSSTGTSVTTTLSNATSGQITQTYTVVGTSNEGCTISTDVTVTINPLPNIPIISGPDVICSGQANIIYSISNSISSNDSYSWLGNPAGINGFINNGKHDTCLTDFSGLGSGNTSCSLTATVQESTHGCKSVGVKNISISGQAPLLEPVIEFSTNPFTLTVLYSQTSTTYRWGRDFSSSLLQDTVGFNNEFGNQNLQLFLVPDTNATPLHFNQFYYWVEYYDDDINCKQKAYYNLDSSAMFQSLTGIQNKLIDFKNYFTIYPNPSNGDFSIRFNAKKSSQKDRLFIYDLSGKEIENHFLNSDSDELIIQAEKKLSPGIYFVKYIDFKGGCQISKIIIQ